MTAVARMALATGVPALSRCLHRHGTRRGACCVFRAPESAADVQAAVATVSQVQLSLPHLPARYNAAQV